MIGAQLMKDDFSDGILEVFYTAMVVMNIDSYRFSALYKKEELKSILYYFACRLKEAIKTKKTLNCMEWERKKHDIINRALWDLRYLMGKEIEEDL